MVGLFPEIEIVLVLTDSFQRSPILQCIMGDINSKLDFGIRKHGGLGKYCTCISPIFLQYSFDW